MGTGYPANPDVREKRSIKGFFAPRAKPFPFFSFSIESRSTLERGRLLPLISPGSAETTLDALGRACCAIRLGIPHPRPYGNPHPIPYHFLQEVERESESLIRRAHEAAERKRR